MSTAIVKLEEAAANLKRQDFHPSRELAITLVNAAHNALLAAQADGDPAAAHEVRKKLKTIEDWFKLQRARLINSNLVVAERLRAERAIGGMLANSVQHRGGRPKKLYDQRTVLPAGLDRHDSSHWQRAAQIADADFEQWILDMTAEEEEISTAALLRWLNTRILGGSTGDEWYTPPMYIESVRAVMGGIDLDPASCEFANRTVRADKIYTIDDDGLLHDWPGRVFLNPPYSQNMPFAEKIVEQFERGITSEAVVLVGAHAIETQWFAPYWDRVLCFTGHRITFNTPDGERKAGNINGSSFIYFGHQENKFADEFSKHGYVVKRWP